MLGSVYHETDDVTLLRQGSAAKRNAALRDSSRDGDTEKTARPLQELLSQRRPPVTPATPGAPATTYQQRLPPVAPPAAWLVPGRSTEAEESATGPPAQRERKLGLGSQPMAHSRDRPVAMTPSL